MPVPIWLYVSLLLTLNLNLVFGSSNLIVYTCFLTLSSSFHGFDSRLLLFSACDLWFDSCRFRFAVSPSRIELWVLYLAPCALDYSRYTLHVVHCVLHFIPCALWVICYPISIAYGGFHHMNSVFYLGVRGMRLLY